MNWGTGNEWNNNVDGKWDNPTPLNPLDALSQDQLLVKHEELKERLAQAKEAEMELRKYIVKRAFPNAHEGTNTLDLGNGYSLKAGVKFNYKLEDNDKVEAGLDRITKIGNQGGFIADRLVSWTPNFLLTEYRALQEQADGGSEEAKAILKEVNSFLIVSDAAPTLEIKAPKAKK